MTTNNKKCLVTQSLISAISWAKTAPNTIIKGGDGQQTWKVKALHDLKATLNREPYTPNIAATRGISFEKKLYSAVKTATVPEKSSAIFRQVVEEIMEGDIQYKKGMDETIDGEECYLYIKEDVHFPDLIVDIKTTEKYNEDKYRDSFQHVLYCYVDNIPKFRYTVAEWDVYPLIKKLHHVDLKIDLEIAKRLVHKNVTEAFNFMKKHGLWEAYRENYCLY